MDQSNISTALSTGIAPKSNSRLQSKLLIAAAVLLALSVLSGVYSGYNYGRSKATLQSVTNINNALHYYFQDQGVYPTADQFSNQNILTALNYLGQQPQPSDVSGACKAYPKFIYSQSGTQSFSLQFCLTAGVGGFSAGVHEITEKGTK